MNRQSSFITEAPSQAAQTSKDAARAIEPKLNKLQLLVLAAIEFRGKLGATDNEIQAYLGMGGSTERPRRIELLRAGKVRDSGIRRNRSIVWIVNKASS